MQYLFSICFFLYTLEYGQIQDFISPAWAYLLNGDSCYRIMNGVCYCTALIDFAKAGFSCILFAKRLIFFTISSFGDKSITPPPRLPNSATAKLLPSPTPLISGYPGGPIHIYNSSGGVINIIYPGENMKSNIPHKNAG